MIIRTGTETEASSRLIGVRLRVANTWEARPTWRAPGARAGATPKVGRGQLKEYFSGCGWVCNRIRNRANATKSPVFTTQGGPRPAHVSSSLRHFSLFALLILLIILLTACNNTVTPPSQ